MAEFGEHCVPECLRQEYDDWGVIGNAVCVLIGLGAPQDGSSPELWKVPWNSDVSRPISDLQGGSASE